MKEKNLQKYHWVCFLPASIARHGAWPEVWFVYPLRLHCRKRMLRLQAVVIGGSFLFMAGSSCLLPPLSTGTLSGLNLCRPCPCFHSLREPICVSFLLCLEDTAVLHHPSPLALRIFLPPLPNSSRSPEARGLRKTFHFKLSVPRQHFKWYLKSKTTDLG